MGFDQYHEAPEELSEETHTYVCVIQSLIEEARAVLSHAQKEEFIHFGMDLEFLLRRTPVWPNMMRNLLFKKGDLTELAENAEETIPEG